jgi:hypothetical protein
MPKKPESRLQRRIKEALKKEFPRSLFVKAWGGLFQVKGLPDLIGCIGPYFVAVEVKTPDGKLTMYQNAMISAINDIGAIAVVAHSPEEAVNLIKSRLTSIRNSKA